jgi:dTDP-4-dehydrorhamnose 3,5-epimerase
VSETPAQPRGGWFEGAIPGVWRRAATFHADERGAFGELWRENWRGDLPPEARDSLVIRQANLSRSRPRVLRGLHVHQRQADLWAVIEGDVFIALVDLRPILSRTGAVAVETIDAHPGDVFYLPEGVAHGFYAHDGLTLLYFVTNEYDGSDEHGFAWNDPIAAVPWPDPEPILSGRDATAPSLDETVARLRGEGQQSATR